MRIQIMCAFKRNNKSVGAGNKGVRIVVCKTVMARSMRASTLAQGQGVNSKSIPVFLGGPIGHSNRQVSPNVSS